MDTQYYVMILLVFLAVVFMLEGLYLFWKTYRSPEVKRIERRLRSMTASHRGSDERELLKERLLSDVPVVQDLLQLLPNIHKLDHVLLQSGVQMKLASFIVFTGVAAVVGFLVAKILGLITPLALVLALVCLGGPVMYVLRQRQARLTRFEALLPDALDLMTRALRAGHALPHTVRMIGEEMPEPLGEQFRMVFDEVNYGFALHDALNNLANRVPSADLRFFVLAVTLQRDTGGNLAELLSNISTLIRARLNLLAKVRVLAAEGVLSAWVLGLLPVVLAILINIVNPQYMQLLWTDEMGIKMVIGGLVMAAIGVLWIRKLVRLRV